MPLEQMFRRQLAFTSKVLRNKEGLDLRALDDVTRTRWTKEYVLSLMSELSEILGCLNWKHHRTTDVSARIDLIEEMIDVQKYTFGLMQLWGVTLEELESEFNRKSDVVEQRWRQEYELPAILQARQVVLVDIDGVLCDYPRYFLDWALDQHPGLEREQVNKTTNPLLWERLKDEYRLSGAKRHAYVKAGAREGLERLRQLGFPILLLSNRPVKQYSRIVADTIEWLKNNQLPYDYIYWTHFAKGVDILDRFPTVQAVFDDDGDIVSAVAAAGVLAFHIGDGAYETLSDAVTEMNKEIVLELET